MTLSGVDALRALNEATHDIRREEDDIVHRVSRSAELVTKLREQEGQLLYQLAASLDEPTQEALSTSIGTATHLAHEALEAHAARLEATETELAEIDDEIGRAIAERVHLQLEAVGLDTALRKLAAEVRPQLGADLDYTMQRDSALGLAAIAAESARKAVDAEADRKVKSQLYEGDPLFSYLWHTGYDTKTYRANPLIRFLDSKVAALVDYPTARPNYSMLTEIPVRLREHADRQRENARIAAEDVARLEAEAIDAAGGQPTREAMETLVTTIESIDAKLVVLEDSRDTTLKTQRELAQGNDFEFRQAVAGLAAALDNPTLRQLLSSARTNGVDDMIVQQIDDIRQRIQEQGDETREDLARLTTLAERRRDIEDIVHEFKQLGIDSPHAHFSDSALVGDTLNGFLRGQIDAVGYWERWCLAQSWSAGGQVRSSEPGDLGLRIGGPGGGWGRIDSDRRAGMTFSRPRADRKI